MRHQVAGIAIVVLACLSLSVLASDMRWVQAYTAITASDLGALVNWLQWAGHITRYERLTDNSNSPVFRPIGKESQCLLFMYNRAFDSSGDAAFTSLQLYDGFAFRSQRGPSCATINEWNARYRASRAYIDDVGDPCIEADLSLKGGVSEDAIKQWILAFIQQTLPTFMEHIGWQ